MAESGGSSDASTSSIASILDNGQAQTPSGDFANVFQRLSSGLQSLVVQLQSITTGSGASSTTAAATPTPDGTMTDTPASTAGPPADGPTVFITGADALRTAAMHRPSSGNRALQGDIDAMINDLHGFIQVGSGDAMAAVSGANDNAATTDPPATSQSSGAASDMAATNAFNETIYGYAQTLMQALQNYSVASTNVANTQRDAIVSATG
jgi:hypothetical protein